MTGYYDRDGRPISAEEWGEHFQDFDYRIVKRSPVDDGTIITVWLGHDGYEGPGVEPAGTPLIFGTLLPDGREVFHATVEEALGFHARRVKFYPVRNNRGAPRYDLDDENAWVHQRINDGETLTDIGREIGVTPQALGRRLRRYRLRNDLEGREPYPGNRFNAINPGAYRMERPAEPQ